MDEKDWLILTTLYEKNSITKTAATLFISQPALSNRLQQIEARFGAKIVVRTKKGVQFTPEGEYLVKGAYDILKRIQIMDEQIQNMSDTPSGVLRIGASNFSTKYILPELLSWFKSLYPSIEFKVITGWSRDIVNLVYNNDIHLGFVRGDYSWPGEQLLLFEEKMYVCSKTSLRLIDLPHMPRIDYGNDYSNQLLLDKWWSENYSVSPHIGMTVDRVDTCKEMVFKGLGYAFLPATILGKNHNMWIHELRFKSGAPLNRKTWMLYNKETMDFKVVKAFFDFIRNTDFSSLLPLEKTP